MCTYIINLFSTKDQDNSIEERTVFSTSGAETPDSHMGKKMNLNSYFLSHTKINLKWITDINVKATNKTLLEENIGEKSCDLAIR